MKHIIKLISISLFSITVTGCYVEQKLKTPNPTSYIFNANVEQVRIAIKEGLGDYQIKCLDLVLKGHRDYYDRDSIIYSILQNQKDAILRPFSCNVESKIYFRFGKSLPYDVEFHVHLDSISENKTKIEIFTLNPKVIIFQFWNHGVGFSWDKKVPPSTIDEYEILLSIGEQLGEEGMPECNYTKKWLKYQKRVIRREERREVNVVVINDTIWKFPKRGIIKDTIWIYPKEIDWTHPSK
jgi:hypothetical protein